MTDGPYRPPPPVPVVHRAFPVAAGDTPQGGGGNTVMLALSIAIAVALAIGGLSQLASVGDRVPDAPNPAPPPTAEAERPQPPVLDPGAALPLPQTSATLTRSQVEDAMPQLLAFTFAAAVIDDPEIPAGLQFPLSFSTCDTGAVRGSVEV